MTISRGQMERQLRMGGGIMNVVPRDQALLGGIKKAVKKVGKTVGKIAKSDIGKAALLYAGTAGLGSLAAGKGFGSLMQLGTYAPSTVLGNLGTAATNFFKGKAIGVDKFDNIVRNQSGLSKVLGSIGLGDDKGIGTIGKFATLAGLTGFLTSQYGMTEEQAEEVTRDPEQLKSYLRRYYTNLNPNAGSEEIEEFVRVNSADGGRIGFAEGDPLPPDPTQPVNPFKPKPIGPVLPNKMMASDDANERLLEQLFEQFLEEGFSPAEAAKKARETFERMGMRRIEETRGLAALGGKMDTASENAMQAAGIEGLPIRENQAGIKELDLRETGGFIQPVGIKEKEDDIPAMLSNNEFVMTADAVRGMGNGNVELGAQRMYDQMKRLEAGGKA